MPKADGVPVFLTVGIGASAGGLEAFKSFFGAMPPNSGLAFVLVQHLSPDHKSMLAELLGKSTSMDVIEAKDGVRVKPNCVFVTPPDATMTIGDGCLKIVHPAPPRERRRPIDTFFQSLAEDQGENAVCIILSGTGSDGAIGLTAVKEHGGLTLAQAEYDSHAMAGMPESAANTGLVDDVLAVEAMPARVISHQRHLANTAAVKDEEGIHKDAPSQLSAILRALHARTGHDFSEYKEKTLVRRLQRRMQVLQVETPQAYRERLKEDPEELDLLLRELLISVTHFFRDPGAFDALNETVLKGLMASRNANDDIRIWVPGCATGEEVYTIAILLREALDGRRPRPKIQIFGTDLDDRAISTARIGFYRKPVAGLSPERLERWFTVEGEGYCVAPEIREMCVFSGHSVIKHPPFSKLDLISCRNLLIYLDAPMQDRLMRTFHYALKPGGKLFLGSSESVTRATRLFSVCDKRHRIFERRDVLTPSLPSFSAGMRTIERAAPDTQQAPADDQIEKHIRQIVERLAPPHLLLDRSNRIVRFSGGAVGPYLEPSPGPASFALFDILRKTLRPAARDVLQQLRASDEPVRRDDVPIRIDGKPRLVSLVAERLGARGTEADYVVLALHDAGPGQARGKIGDVRAKSVEELHSLEQELRTTRTQLQSTIDELETANEEMKSSNEEYQSVNEELQSSNEELETAKEEMQSVNEELQTINTEIASKNEQ
ncbi:MAG: SAM-dependent methyltransferase, partial [Sandarakinorhabdus sp.]|nr:SAM-dependent methyltransferase [Sandarakinorhabdus sp.]